MQYILILLLVFFAKGVWAEDIAKVGEHRALQVGNSTREYYLYIPKEDKKPRTLVVVLHGGGGTPRSAARMSGFSELADTENFIVAYPAGLGRLPTWNAGECCGYAERTQADDVGFIRKMVEDIRANAAAPIDSTRIYLTGMSNGGMMAYRLACEMADVFVAIAPVAGAMNVNDCKPNGRPSLIIFHALDDQHVLYNGGMATVGLRAMFGKQPAPDRSVQEAVAFWRKQNYCRQYPETQAEKEYGQTHYFCAGGRDLEIYTLKTGGHSWPGGVSYTSEDKPLQSLSATKIMWQFFMKHPPKEVF